MAVTMRERGFTVIELMVSLTVTSIIFLGILQSYSNAVAASDDQKQRLAASLQAKAVLEAVGAELKTLGNGVPFDQANFQIGENTLSDVTVTEPIIVANTTADEISFRINESGRTHLLTADFDPSLEFTVYLTDVNTLVVGDTIYITNSVLGEDDGLYGVINSVNTLSKSVVLDLGMQFGGTATFETGSLFEKVSVVTYDNIGGGITRSNGTTIAQMAPSGVIRFKYFTNEGVEVGLPLTHDKLINSLRSIQVTIEISTPRPLSSGNIYTAIVTQSFALRNLVYLI